MKKIHSNVEYYQSLLKNTEILVAEHELMISVLQDRLTQVL